MKTLGRCTAIALIFFVGTLSVIHVDRQGGFMNRRSPQIMKTVEETVENAIETVENTIEKYASLR